jgi:hypothetical protein
MIFSTQLSPEINRLQKRVIYTLKKCYISHDNTFHFNINRFAQKIIDTMVLHTNISTNISSRYEEFGSLWMFVTGIALSSAIIVLHCIALFILIKTKKLSIVIRTVVLNLGLADTLVGFAILIISICGVFTVSIPTIWVIISFQNTATVSYIFIAVMSIERLMSVAYPNFYLLNITYEKVRNVCLFIWILNIIKIIIMLLLLTTDVRLDILLAVSDLFILIIYVFVVSSLMTSSIYLYKTSKTQIQNISVFVRPRPKAFIIQTYGKTVTVLLICGLMLICTLPGFVEILMRNLDKETFTMLNIPFKFLLLLQHILNPFLYIFRFKGCRKNLVKYTSCCKKKTVRPVEDLLQV